MPGNQYFNLFTTNDKKLAERIIQGLYSSNQAARIEDGTPFLFEQPSTKVNTYASSPIHDQGSNQSSGIALSEAKVRPEHIDSMIQLRISSAADDPQAAAESLKEAETRLGRLIDERLLDFKETIKSQLMDELKVQLAEQVKAAVKEELALQLSKVSKTQPYTINVQSELDEISIAPQDGGEN